MNVKASAAQMKFIGTLIAEREVDAGTVADIHKRAGYMTKAQASGTIQFLQGLPKRSA